MNVNATNAAGTGMQRPGPPDSDQLAARMASSVVNGDISVEELQSHLTERLGIEDTSEIVDADGNLDVNKLSELLEDHRPQGPGGMGGAGGPPPPPPGKIEDTATVLTEALGADTVASATNEDGSLDMDTLLAALQSALSEQGDSAVGNLIDVSA